MAEKPQDTQATRLLVEAAANRVIMRAILVHLIMSDPDKAEQTVRSLQGAIRKMAGASIPDMDTEMRAKAVALVEQRAQAFLSEFAVKVAAA